MGSASDGAPVWTRAGTRISALFDAHARLVLGVCRTHLRNPQDAEDAAQQTFLSAYRALLGGTTPRDPAAWLATIARNECRRRIARRLRSPAISSLGADAFDVPADADTVAEAGARVEIELLTTALAELPERQREAVLLRDVYGLSYDEVSAALSVSTPAVESLLSRGRRRLSERVRPVPLVVPAYLEEQLARLIPDFGADDATVAAGGGAAGLLAKLASASFAGKVAAATAAATLAVGADVAIRRDDDGAVGAKRRGEARSAPVAAPFVDARGVAVPKRVHEDLARATARPHAAVADDVAADTTPLDPAPEPADPTPEASPTLPANPSATAVTQSRTPTEEDHSGRDGGTSTATATTGGGELDAGNSGPGSSSSGPSPSSGSSGSDNSGPGSTSSADSSGSSGPGRSGSDD